MITSIVAVFKSAPLEPVKETTLFGKLNEYNPSGIARKPE
jgi:hypothetical protein